MADDVEQGRSILVHVASARSDHSADRLGQHVDFGVSLSSRCVNALSDQVLDGWIVEPPGK
jgi:hypothetical protein